MIRILKIFFGYRGTWFWACRKMQEGETVCRFRDSGVVHFNYDSGRRKIIAVIYWDTPSSKGSIDATAELSVCMEDVFATDFKLQIAKPPVRKIGCFAIITGKSTPHRFKIGDHVVIMSHDNNRAYVKDRSFCQGEYVLLKDLQDETL